MVKYCKCGCGNIIPEHISWVRGHFLLGRTLKEAWGDKADEIVKCRSAKLKGKTYEDIYGEKIGQEKRIKQSLRQKGKKLNRIKASYKKGMTYEQIYGQEKTLKIKEKIRIANTKNGLYWTKEKIKRVYLSIPNIRKSQVRYYRKKGLLPDSNTVRRYFRSWENLAKECNKPFLNPIYKYKGKFGQNEEKILDYIENEKNIKLLRGYRLGNYYVDGYDKENNTVYEVDEEYHQYNKMEDKKREEQLKCLCNCDIVRINEKEFFDSLNHQQLTNFILR